MLASHEVRWFFKGSIDAHPLLKSWVENSSPVKKREPVSPPKWAGRADDAPDVYIVVPGSSDMGIKWREGQLQIKGLQSSLGTQLFAGPGEGRVERWIKWSYQGPPIKQAFADWFVKTGSGGPVRVEVFKKRCLRKVRMDTLSGEKEEVDASYLVDRGGNLEVTDLRVGSESFCSVAFETFPDDSAMHSAFTHFVNLFLQGLQGAELSESNSMSYPAWLLEIT
jgi:hypothetical protein